MEIATVLQSLSLLLGFYMAWNIGANDVANAMGTSVGSRALTLAKAVFLAAILEFSGAFLVGSSVSETIQRGIISPDVFQHSPMTFVLGMLASLLATGILLQIASYRALPISTTHAIIGAIIGFGTVAGGINAIHWSEVGRIALSWLLSPVLSGLLSYTVYRVIQSKILLTPNPILATQKMAPFFVFCCFSASTLSFLYQGLAPLDLDMTLTEAIPLSTSIGLLAAYVSQRWMQKMPAFQLASHSRLSDAQHPVETIFISLQIVSACMVAFAHGANDVANAIGPVAAIFNVLKTNTLSAEASVPSWLLALGGSGIVLGLATWGWRVIETIGKKITELTPTRGFAAEFGAATTILFASKLGLPISTTHALVGAVLGVGVARGLKALNLQTIKEIIISWIVTIPLCAILSILLFYGLKMFFVLQP